MSSNDFLNNLNPTNPKITNDEEKVSIPYIICAAIWFNDRKIYNHQPKNIKEGIVICGRRHHNCFTTAFEVNSESKLTTKSRPIQGFATSDDRFVDRKEAGEIAYKAGQTKELTERLFSEDLY